MCNQNLKFWPLICIVNSKFIAPKKLPFLYPAEKVPFLEATTLHSAIDLHTASHFSIRFTFPFSGVFFLCAAAFPARFCEYPAPLYNPLFLHSASHAVLSAHFFRSTHQRREFERQRAFGLASALEGITDVRSNEPFSTVFRCTTDPLPYTPAT